MAIVGVLTTILSGNNAPLLATLAQSQTAMTGYASGTSASAALARTALLGIGAGAAVGVGLAINAARDFEDAMTGVRKTVDEADLTAAGLTFESLGTQFRQMATEIPVAATELAAIGETAGALGIRATDIENFTRTVALLGSTTDLSTSAAAEALGKVGTILGLTGSAFNNFADILVNLGNKGASTESEIIEVTKRFAAAGQQAGLSTGEILAFSSAIASAGVEPEAAGSSLSRLFGNMVLGAANATDAGKAFATTTGRSFADFSNLVETDTVGAMLLVLDSLKDLDKFGQAQALKAMGITAVRDVNAIRALAGTYETNLIPALGNAQRASGALAIEAEKRFQSLNVQLTLLGNSVTELGISLGTALLPPLTTITQAITGAVNSVSTWAAANPELSSSLLPVIAGVALLGVGVALLGLPFVAILAVIALVVTNMGNLERGIQRVVDAWNTLTSLPGFQQSPQAQTFSQQFQEEHGRRPNPVELQAGGVGFNPTAPGYNTNPMIDATRGIGPHVFGGGVGQRGAPITLHHTTINQIDGREIARSVETTLYNDAGVFSSGFSTDDRNRH